MASDALYHDALLRLARAGAGSGTIDAPDATARRDNPLCGDDVAVQIRMEAGLLRSVAFRVRGCILCQAAASAIGSAAPGQTAAGIASGRAAAEALLREGAPAPEGAWRDLAAFLPVHGVPSRHECVLLPFDALAEALASLKR